MTLFTMNDIAHFITCVIINFNAVLFCVIILISPSHIRLSIIMSHGPKYTAYIAPGGNIDDVWTGVLNWLPGHYCEKCHNCQLRRSTMELWTVDKEGIGKNNPADFCVMYIHVFQACM